jgi:diguanylate cyclase (GGDEF)-like protein/PAS domain S-box-containing protein
VHDDRNAMLLDVINEGIYELNTAGICTFCNAACVILLGYKYKAELIGQPINQMLHSPADGRVHTMKNTNPHQDIDVFFKKNGTCFPVDYSLHSVPRGDGTLGSVVIFSDISKQKRVESELFYLSTHDVLTGLINQQEFEKRTNRVLSFAQTHDINTVFCFISLESFNDINNLYGHIAGDAVLNKIGALIQSHTRSSDLLARLKGDVFALMITHCSMQNAEKIATSILNSILKHQFSWQRHKFNIKAGVGLIPISSDIKNFPELLTHADLACHIAKEKGHPKAYIYDANNTEIRQKNHEVLQVTQINQSLLLERFCLYAQTIASISKPQETNYELLIRMQDKHEKIITPAVFLPAAERYNLMITIDKWVVSKAFILIESNPNFYKNIGFCSINLSGQSLAEPEMQDFILNQLIQTTIPPGKICFEITESAVITDLSAASLFMTKMKVLGCRFALDDFGRGLSSFAYLKYLDVDYLKIDGMFIKNIIADTRDKAMVHAMHQVAEGLNIKTVAEFVTDKAIILELKKIGIHYIQGYALDKPQPFHDVLNHFSKQ